ncbi:MAG TPA: cation diffusion facilitator family transporter [Burkholderiaceae bacterium]
MQVGSYLKVSAGVAVATIALKAVAWWLTGSVSLLSDAIEGLVNLAGAGFALAMVSWASQPPDEGHPYGHHKAEYFSSGFEGVLIVAAAIAIVGAAGERLAHPAAVEALGPGLALSLGATAMNGMLAWAMLRKAAAARSIALEADARHLITDVWTSVGVVAGLIGVRLTGWLWLDPVVALCVAGNIVREGVSLVWRSADGLMDMAVEPEVRAQIEKTLAAFHGPAVRFDHVVTRRAGQRRFVDMHMHLPAAWTLGRAARLRAEVERALMRDVAGLRTTIQLLPTDVEAYVEEFTDSPPGHDAGVPSTQIAPASPPASPMGH